MIDRPWPGAPTTPSMSMAIKVNMWICIFGQSQQPTTLGRPTPSTRDHSVGRSVGRSVTRRPPPRLSISSPTIWTSVHPIHFIKNLLPFQFEAETPAGQNNKKKNTPELTASSCPLLPAGCHKLLHWKWNCTRWFTLMETGHTEIPAPPAGLALRIVAHKSGPLRVWMSGWEVVNSS